MHIADAQRDVRVTFLGGFAGQIVSGALWLASSALATWGSPRRGMLLLVLGGAFIFPLMQLVLRAMGRPAALPAGHPMNGLGMQAAFVVPLGLPIVGAATVARTEWFYPAMMVLVGAHYLPFVFLYGMRMFAVLCGALVAGGVAIGLYVPEPLTLGGWVTGAVLVGFAFAGRAIAGRG